MTTKLKKVDLVTYSLLYDYVHAEFSWGKNHHQFTFADHFFNELTRQYLDILHTGLDGYTVDANGKKQVTYLLDPKLKKHLEGNVGAEIFRTQYCELFNRRGLATPTDYLHLVKSYLVYKKKLPYTPFHKKLFGSAFVKDLLDDIEYDALDILKNVYLLGDRLNPKNLFPPAALKSESGQGRLKANPLVIPDHILGATALIIKRYHGVKEVQQLYEKGSKKVKKVDKSQFYKDWRKYKFDALRYCLLKYTYEDYMSEKQGVTQVFYNQKQKSGQTRWWCEMEVNLPDNRFKKIQKHWSGRKKEEKLNITNPLIITAKFNKNEHRKKDFFGKILPYQTIYKKIDLDMFDT